MVYNPDIHHRKSIRLKNYNYSEIGYYFITICVEGRRVRFGEIKNNTMVLNPEGEMIKKWWQELEIKFPGIRLDEYIIMPNHIHGIIEIIESVGADLCVCPPEQGEHIGSPLQERPNEHTISSPQKHTIPHMIQWFKTMTTNECIRGVKSSIFPPFEKHIWQRNYWEHIIRNEKSLMQIREYIRNNPASWLEDSLFNGTI